MFTTNLSGVKQSDPALHPHEDKEQNGMEWNGVCVCVYSLTYCSVSAGPQLPTLEWTAAIEVTVMTVWDSCHLCEQVGGTCHPNPAQRVIPYTHLLQIPFHSLQLPIFFEQAVYPKLPLVQDRLIDVTGVIHTHVMNTIKMTPNLSPPLSSPSGGVHECLHGLEEGKKAFAESATDMLGCDWVG